MPYNTGNPVPSTDARDFMDNVQNTDVAVTSQQPTWTDRLGAIRKSWAGIEAEDQAQKAARELAFNQWLSASGFEPVHLTYVAGQELSVLRPTQLIDYNGSVYRVAMPATFPVALSGTWSNDAAKLVDVGDQSLRASLNSGAVIPFGRFNHYGGQLAALKASLGNPFEQFTGIAFLGDSITWGATVPGNISPGSDLTTLATRRDYFATATFVNEFKRYLGRQYFENATPVISNWAASSAGEAIATYTRNVLLYPNRAPFTFTATGTASITDAEAAQAVTGYQATMTVSAGANAGEIAFNMTGEAFNLVFSAIDSDAGDYELFTDGVSRGMFSFVPNGGTIVTGTFGNRIQHTFPFIKNKTVRIRLSGAAYSSVRRLRIEAIEIPKTVRITNQGISGSNSTRYKSRALTTTYLPDIAVTPKDNYALVQLGTNDRLDSTWPNGLNAFEQQMGEIFDILDPLCAPIVMCANHVDTANQAGKRFTMQDIRGALNKLARTRQYDFIDNYAIFNWSDPAATLADGLHPNTLGHQMIYRNIVEALEQA